MVLRFTESKYLILLIALCFFITLPVAADEMLTSQTPRSISDVPSWITGSSFSEIKSPAAEGYVVNEEVFGDLYGFSDFNSVDATRDESEVPDWIKTAAGVSGFILIILAVIHFLPSVLGRVTDTDLCATRNSVLTFIDTHPGASFSLLKNETKIPRSTLRYHLTVLARENKIVSRRTGHIYHYFLNGSNLTYAETIHLAFCQNPSAEKILTAVSESPGISGVKLASRVGITPGTLTWHLGRLEEKGIIRIVRSGREIHIYPEISS